MNRGLTARAVKTRLTRAGVDYKPLTITEREEVSRIVDLDASGPWRRRCVVTISGPRDARWAASRILYDAGLGCAPFGDHDVWQA